MKTKIVAQIPACKISTLREAEYNPKTLDPAARKALKADLRKFGMVEPILVNKRTMTVINGHQRMSVWKELGNDTIPAFFVDVDEQTEKKMNLDLNNPHIEGQWEHTKLAPLQERLKDIPNLGNLEIGMIGTGIVRMETIEDLPPEEQKTLDTTGYLKVFRLHFLPEEWAFWEEKGNEVMKEQGMTSYSELALWLARNYGV